MTWTNPVLNSDGTVTGTMTYRSRNAGTDYIASTQLTVQKKYVNWFYGCNWWELLKNVCDC